MGSSPMPATRLPSKTVGDVHTSLERGAGESPARWSSLAWFKALACRARYQGFESPLHRAIVAQMEERLSEEQEVDSSKLSFGTMEL